MTFEEMAIECSRLMDQVEADNYNGSSDDGDSRMVLISEYATLLSALAPELLDKRFG
jgi:hypothetical protein